MTTILLPFHQDERIGRDSITLPAGIPTTEVAPQLDVVETQWQRLAALYNHLADEVATRLDSPEPTTVVTGDCLALLGTLAGTQRAGLSPSLVWFDAHGDVHTVASSTSGYLGGMALRMAVGGDPDLLTRPLGMATLPEAQAVLVDARDLDPAEKEYLAQAAVTHTSVDTMDAALLPGSGPVILHVDLDVIDASEIPGLRFPAPNGPTSGSVIDALRRLLDSGRVAVLDIACPWYDPRDEDELRRRAALLARVLELRASN
ncbi:MAG: hypothetical protein BGO26_18745 [Actinobacteria bacterium 69-20]|nr:arginase family protein [Actinomycetota bacterium]OJV24981.1 MAG: hypothetical protein BGO26_18745 [Actinobacteria bacterium 69-20]